ncbi:hypothetical protein MGU_05444 [Metarhizium guizhouense ARSEF 977]|uniref:Uncharacterized protein n=1 Tax=Metarhizium guizhouense (strain ARSEF 977) TaxID=1276136 RepID=A0A0B4H5W6_METGA|nr:hypothetical protein MGU_05444 [Metarhizium guizhouense ARSEF 977]
MDLGPLLLPVFCNGPLSSPSKYIRRGFTKLSKTTLLFLASKDTCQGWFTQPYPDASTKDTASLASITCLVSLTIGSRRSTLVEANIHPKNSVRTYTPDIEYTTVYHLS